jgi:VanZ family protein
MLPSQNKTAAQCGLHNLKARCTSILFLIMMVYLVLPFNALGSNPTEEHTVTCQQQDTTSGPNNRRLWITGSAHVLLYTATLVGLDGMWYRDYPRSSFHFFDDLPDWKQMDKAAHAANAYQLSRLSFSTFRHAGLSNNKAAIWGSISGAAFLTTVEIMDGFSSEWGASWSDLAANTIGSLSFFAQQMAWQEQKILWKYSFSRSGMEKYRPDLLGSNLIENILKDYNGLTFWWSFNIRSLAGINTPEWLNLAIGYSAHGMLGGRHNPASHNGMNLPEMARYRQFYLAPDIDFARIPSQNSTLKQVFNILNLIKLPAPAIEYNQQQGFSFHLLFF